jgi:tyrosyl-tRNA synthetase
MALLQRGSVDLVDAAQLRAKLERAAKTGQPLTVKTGFDPSSPDLHLGHTVLLRKMRHFQRCGHRVVFLIGDFTARIGDPTGKKVTRPQLTPEEVEVNFAPTSARSSKCSAGGDGHRLQQPLARPPRLRRPDPAGRALHPGEDDGARRLSHPLPGGGRSTSMSSSTRWSGYDSIALKADVELGGTDQIFNLLVGRRPDEGGGDGAAGGADHPLLVGLDGTEKMSKSLGNAIAVEDPPQEIYGKTMSISDSLMWSWYLLLTDVDEEELKRRQKQVEEDPPLPSGPSRSWRAAGGRLPRRGGGAQEAEGVRGVFAGGGLPEDIPERELEGSWVRRSSWPPAALQRATARPGAWSSKGRSRSMASGPATPRSASPSLRALPVQGGEAALPPPAANPGRGRMARRTRNDGSGLLPVGGPRAPGRSLRPLRAQRAEPSAEPTRFLSRSFGAPVEIDVLGVEPKAAEAAFVKSAEALAALEKLLDPAAPGSELTQLNLGPGAEAGSAARPPVDPLLLRLLERAQGFCIWSEGAHGALGGELYRLWGLRSPVAGPPSGEALKSAVASAGCGNVRIDLAKSTVDLAAGARLEPRGSSKGWEPTGWPRPCWPPAAPTSLVRVGSVWRAGGSGPGGKGWAVDLPRLPGTSESAGRIVLRDRSLALIAPEPLAKGGAPGAPFNGYLTLRTGRPPEGVLAVAALTQLALDAEGLAVSLYVMGPREGQLRAGSLSPKPSASWSMGSGSGEGPPLQVHYRWSEGQLP